MQGARVRMAPPANIFALPAKDGFFFFFFKHGASY